VSADYSVPNCPWCGMPSRSKPEYHHEWETVRMECGSEIYPPRATTPSQQSEACKVIASTTADRDALRAELDRTKGEAEALRKALSKSSDNLLDAMSRINKLSTALRAALERKADA
jgi:hypothetical protein